MFKKSLPTGLSAIALGLGLGLAALSTVPANAFDGRSHQRPFIKQGHGTVHVGPHHHRPVPIVRYRVCSPGKALYTAKRRGLRHVRLGYAGHRFVVVEGRGYRGGIRMAFHRRSSHCSIAWVKRSHRFGHPYRY